MPASFQGQQDSWTALAEALTLVHVNPDDAILSLEASPNKREEPPKFINNFKTPETPKRSRSIEPDDHRDCSERAPKRYTRASPMKDDLHVKQLPPSLTPTPIRVLYHRSEGEGEVFLPGLHEAASVCYPVFSLTGVSTVASIAPDMDEFVILPTREKKLQDSLQSFKLRNLETELKTCRRRLNQEQTLRKQCDDAKVDAERKQQNITMESLKKQEKLIMDLNETKEKLREELRSLPTRI